MPTTTPTTSTLQRKQRSDHGDWLLALAEIRQTPDRDRASALVKEAAARIVRRLRYREPLRPAYGWSGGKDSLALEVVCEAAGLSDCVLVISALEFPAFLTWVTNNMPWGLTVEARTALNLTWLAEHPEMLFPQSAEAASRWFSLVQHAGQRAYARRTGCEMLLLGRRRADGNYLGQRIETGGYAYTDRGGFERYSPIADWSHEDVLHVLAAYDRELPPCYSWPRGFRVGTGSWPARQWTESRAHGWREVQEIDPGILQIAAAAGLPGADEACVA
jgi:3'-phosphoadenosine 5'-phosphosulfate sulfotransferase (PAPS reductase)/FAD synthetase